MPRHYPGKPAQPPQRKVTRDDELHAEAIAHAARGVVAQLRRAYDGRPARQIGQLVREEIQNIAQDAVSFWVAKRVEQWNREHPGVGLDQWILSDPSVSDLL